MSVISSLLWGSQSRANILKLIKHCILYTACYVFLNKQMNLLWKSYFRISTNSNPSEFVMDLQLVKTHKVLINEKFYAVRFWCYSLNSISIITPRLITVRLVRIITELGTRILLTERVKGCTHYWQQPKKNFTVANQYRTWIVFIIFKDRFSAFVKHHSLRLI